MKVLGMTEEEFNNKIKHTINLKCSNKMLHNGRIFYICNNSLFELRKKYPKKIEKLLNEINIAIEKFAVEHVKELGIKKSDIKLVLCVAELTAFYNKENSSELIAEENLEFSELIMQMLKYKERSNTNELYPLALLAHLIEKKNNVISLRVDFSVGIYKQDGKLSDEADVKELSTMIVLNLD